MNAPTSALLIPCHNAAAVLPRLWRTAVAQTQPFAEIICYDDASTDGTAEVARQLGAAVLGGATNRGAAHARNRLLRATQAEWVHFHDADDLLEPSYHERVLARAAADVDAVICNARWISEATGATETEWRYTESELLAAPIAYLLTHPVGGINGYYRRDALTAVGGFDETLPVWEDADLHVRLAVHGARFRVVEEVLVVALRHHRGISSDLRRNWRCRLTALQRYTTTFPDAARGALVTELENAARELFRHGDRQGARVAVDLSRTLGGNPPTTQSAIVRVCRKVFGAMAALQLQLWARSR